MFLRKSGFRESFGGIWEEAPALAGWNDILSLAISFVIRFNNQQQLANSQ